MNTKIFQLLILVGLLVACSGCDNATKQREAEKQQRDAEKQQHVGELTARLELAQQKSDLDQMFLCLRELQAAGEATTNQLAEYSRVEKAVSILQKIENAKADHNHEEVLNQAAEFLELFPNHPEARQAFKESGLIFSSLEDSLRSIQGSFVKTADGKIVFVSESTSEESETNAEPDTAKVLYNLNQANESVDKALQLDSQFEPALKLKKAINDCRDTLGFVICISVLSSTELAGNKYIDIYNMAAQGYNNARNLDINTAAPFEIERVKAQLQNISDKLPESLKEAELPMKESDRLVQMLGDLKNTEVADLCSSATEMNAKLHKVADGVESFGGSKDSELMLDESVSELKEWITKFKQSAPNVNNISTSIEGFASLTENIVLFKTPEKTQIALEKYKLLITP